MIKFTSKSSASVTMFDADAMLMIKMLGHTGTIPGAFGSDDIKAALTALNVALEARDNVKNEQADANSYDDEEERPVRMSTKAYPLIQLLESSLKKGESVIWDKDASVF